MNGRQQFTKQKLHQFVLDPFRWGRPEPDPPESTIIIRFFCRNFPPCIIIWASPARLPMDVLPNSCLAQTLHLKKEENIFFFSAWLVLPTVSLYQNFHDLSLTNLQELEHTQILLWECVPSSYDG